MSPAVHTFGGGGSHGPPPIRIRPPIDTNTTPVVQWLGMANIKGRSPDFVIIDDPHEPVTEEEKQAAREWFDALSVAHPRPGSLARVQSLTETISEKLGVCPHPRLYFVRATPLSDCYRCGECGTIIRKKRL